MGGGVFSHSQVVENCSDIASELVHFLGNAGYAFGFDQGNGKTAEACYVFGTIVGAYPPSILIIIPVDDIVAAVLDRPVVVFNGMCEAQTSQWSLLFPLERHGLIKVIAPATGTAIPLFRLLLQLRFREAGPECIETMLRYIYYSRGKAEWHDFIEIMHRSDPIIEHAAVRRSELWWKKGGSLRPARFFKTSRRKSRLCVIFFRQRSFRKPKTSMLCKSSDFSEGTVRH